MAIEIPIWEADLCIDCGKCAIVCPHAAIRMKVYDPASSSTCRRRHVEDEVVPQPRRAGHVADRPGRTRRLHRLWSVRDSLPGPRQERGQAQEHQPAPDRGAPRRRAGGLGCLPAAARDRPGPMGSGVGEDQPAAPAAVRVQRRVRRMRRDAVPQAADPTVRRPPADRQRHRMQQHLRRQPADDAVLHRTTRAAGPAWSNSLFEDNAEFGLGIRLGLEAQQHAALSLLDKLAGGRLTASSTPRWPRRSPPESTTSATSRSARSGRGSSCCVRRSADIEIPTPVSCMPN